MRLGGLSLVAPVLLASSAALAAEPSLDLRRFDASTDPKASLALEPTSTPGAGNWNVGAYAGYAYRLMTLSDPAGREVAVPLGHQLSYDLYASLGIGNSWSFGLAMPTLLTQYGSGASAVGWQPPRTALGDLAIEGKRTLIPRGPIGGFGLSLLARATLPSGDPQSGLGNGVPTGQLRLLSELDLLILAFRGSLGVQGRTRETSFLGESFGTALPWAAGIAIRPQALGWDAKGRWSWFLETRGSLAATPTFGSRANSPVSLSASARYALTPELSGFFGAELPVTSAVGLPSFRGVLGLGWSPRFADADGDGIADEADDCPEWMPEDKDGFEDDDGCPDDDNDGDGVPDAEDKCPKEREDSDGYLDDDGCIDPDDDNDAIPDVLDACPAEAGQASKLVRFNGCPPKDSDGDGLADDVDQCPQQAEDFDQRGDDDGCPDLDDDHDGVPDTADDCPTSPGPSRGMPLFEGCPNPDPDGDTLFGQVGDALAGSELLGPELRTPGAPRDLCPDQAEDFDGVEDEDGCPEGPPAKPRVQLGAPVGPLTPLKLSQPLRWLTRESGTELDPRDLGLWRAVASDLLRHPGNVAWVAVRPRDARPQSVQRALAQGFVLTELLRRWTLGPNRAELVDPAALRTVLTPGASVGVAFVEEQVRRPQPRLAPAAPARTVTLPQPSQPEPPVAAPAGSTPPQTKALPPVSPASSGTATP